MSRKVYIKRTYQGKRVTLVFVNKNIELFKNRPSHIEINRRRLELEEKTDEDKISILHIDEHGNIKEDVNLDPQEAEKHFKDKLLS